MALTIAQHASTRVGARLDGGLNDRPTYDADDAAGSPSVYPEGIVFKIVDVTFDSSYATGGEAIAAADVELDRIDAIIPGPLVKSDGSDAYHCEYDPANAKLLAYRDTSTNTTLTQVPNTTNLSAYTTRCLVIGHRRG